MSVSQVEEARISVTGDHKTSRVRQVSWTKDDLCTIDQVSRLYHTVVTHRPAVDCEVCQWELKTYSLVCYY